jgi:hypothetical protein
LWDFENKLCVTHPGTSYVRYCNTIIHCADYRKSIRLKLTEGLVLTEAYSCDRCVLGVHRLKHSNLNRAFWYAVLWNVVRITYVKLE